MIPYRDDNPTSTWAFVNFAIIAANIGLFVWSLMQPSYEATLCTWGAVPADLTGLKVMGPNPCPPGGAPVAYTLFSHMFFHGGLLHLGGNMLYLLIFGNNIEDTLGHGTYLIFYVLCGLAAFATQLTAHPASAVPMVGASGAIAGVLGAYLIRFPLARVHVLLPVVIFLMRFELPAFFLLIFWFLMQVANSFLEAGAAITGGVAWYAHIGGFVAGVLLILVLPKRRKARRR